MASHERLEGDGRDLDDIGDGAKTSDAEGEQVEHGETGLEGAVVLCAASSLREEGSEDLLSKGGVGVDYLEVRRVS